MRNNKEIGGGEVGIEEMVVKDGIIEMAVRVRVRVVVPEQNDQLPAEMEREIEKTGQALKREMFRQGIERADLELALENREGKERYGIQRIGKSRYTFKTIFGTVEVERIRIRHKFDDTTEILSAKSWGTPQQVSMTRGLRDGVCDLAVKESYGQTLAEIETRSGEQGLICRGSVLNILHDEGRALVAGMVERIDKVYEVMPQARLLLPSTAMSEKERRLSSLLISSQATVTTSRDLVAESITEATGESSESEAVILQVDEVVVPAQVSTGHEDLIFYSAVITSAEKTVYLTGESISWLSRQVAAHLTILGVGQGRRRLIMMGDGARWINSWYEDIRIAEKSLIICWYHLVKKCRDLIGTIGVDVVRRREILGVVLKYVWRGKVDKIIDYLTSQKVANPLSLKGMIEYFISRRAYIPNYHKRHRADLWIATTRVEKLNDWSVSARCKTQGREWTAAGVTAIAVLEVTRRNGELAIWRQRGQLPALFESKLAA